MGKSFFEIMSAPSFSLNSKELKIQGLGTFVLASVFILFISFVFSFMWPETFLAILCGLESLNIVGCSLFIFANKINNHFSLNYLEDSINWSFEGFIVLFFFFSLSLFVGMTVMCYLLGNVFAGLGLGFSFFYPIVFMFFRRKSVFNEGSKFIGGKEVLGYSPKHYWVLSLLSGLFLILMSFRLLGHYFVYGTHPDLITCIFLIIFSFVVDSLVLCPDLMNKVLPFDLREEKYFDIYSVLWIIICVILVYVIGYSV